MAGLISTRPSGPRRYRRGVAIIAAVLGLLACGGLIASVPAAAQEFTFPTRAPPLKKSKIALEREKSGQKQMLVQATEIDYDYANSRVAAVGNVQIYYGDSTLEANRVIYDQKTKRLHAEGNVRLTEQDGKVTYGEIMDLSDDYRDGFVDSLRLDAPDQTRMAATRAERTSGNYTVFHNGVYTACAPCKDDPKKPPLWQVKAARIIHDQGEKMMYFEDARLEFFGQPLAWLPYFSAPDPTVKRKTGVLVPVASSSSVYGAALDVPYYWALAPDYDATFAPMITTKQGPLLEGEFRQRLMSGAYSIRAAGIYQLDKDYFLRSDGTYTPGFRDWRGSLESTGLFAINNNWVWGWDGTVLSDRTFLQDYNPRLSRYRITDPFTQTTSEAISQLFISGKGNRSYFDARTIYYFGFSDADAQGQIPVIHPVIDYNYVFDRPILGGELGYRVNFTSLTRQDADFDPITQSALLNGTCTQTANPAIKNTSSCLLRGVPGTYSRFSAEMTWRRSITDSFGQVFTPFASVRADAGAMDIKNDPAVANFIPTGDSDLVRAMPTVGLEYRYPFINVQSWGTQTIEPIAQVIVRPNEQQIGRWPTEDAQSLVYDDSNLFRVDKFSAGTASKVVAAPTTACSTPHSSTGPAPSTRCSASPTACSDKIPLPSAAPRIQASTVVSTRPDPTTWRACRTSQTTSTCSRPASVLTTTRSTRSVLSLRRVRTSTAGVAACFMVTTPPSRRWASSTASKEYWAPDKSSSTPIGSCSEVHATTSMPENSTRPGSE